MQLRPSSPDEPLRSDLRSALADTHEHERVARHLLARAIAREVGATLDRMTGVRLAR